MGPKVPTPPKPVASKPVLKVATPKLSARDEATLAKLAEIAPDAVEGMRARLTHEAGIREQNKAFFTKRANEYDAKVNEYRPAGVYASGKRKGQKRPKLDAGRFLYLEGSGTRSGGVFTKQGALRFLSNLDHFKAVVESMPDLDEVPETDGDETETGE